MAVPMPEYPQYSHYRNPDCPPDPEEWWQAAAGAPPAPGRPDPDAEWRRQRDEPGSFTEPEAGSWEILY